MSRAVEAGPSYAWGWAVVGGIFIGDFFMGHKSRMAEKQVEQAVLHRKKSIRLDPTCQHSYQTISWPISSWVKRKKV
jgi:hypothetical protein